MKLERATVLRDSSSEKVDPAIGEKYSPWKRPCRLAGERTTGRGTTSEGGVCRRAGSLRACHPLLVKAQPEIDGQAAIRDRATDGEVVCFS